MNSSWKRRIQRAAVQWLTLPPDALLDVSRLTCTGGQEVVIENTRALSRVSSEEVEVELDNAAVLLRGQNFTVTLVAQREVHIHGVVEAIFYRRGGGGTR